MLVHFSLSHLAGGMMAAVCLLKFLIIGASAAPSVASVDNDGFLGRLLRGGVHDGQKNRRLPHYRTFDGQTFDYVQDYKKMLTKLEIKGAGGGEGISYHPSEGIMFFDCPQCFFGQGGTTTIDFFDHVYVADGDGDGGDFTALLAFAVTDPTIGTQKKFLMHVRNNPNVAHIWEDAYLSPDDTNYATVGYRIGHTLLAEPDHEFMVDVATYCGDPSSVEDINSKYCNVAETGIVEAAYPLPTFHFAVHLGSDVVAFADSGGLGWDSSHEPHQPPHEQHQPLVDATITLKRGLVPHGGSFYHWMNSLSLNVEDKQDFTIELVETTGGTGPIATWEVTKAYVSKITAPSFDSTSNEVALESLEFVAEEVTVHWH